MPITLTRPTVDELDPVVEALRGWQSDDAPMQLHPGDVGWQWRFGAEAIAGSLAVWSVAGTPVAVGLHDGKELVRLTIAPERMQDDELAGVLARDLSQPNRGLLTDPQVAVEVATGALLRTVLRGEGWQEGESWTPLRLDLTRSLPGPALRIELVAGSDAQVATRVAVHRASFNGSTWTPQRWHAMAAGTPYREARCVTGYDDRDVAVAGATVWSAGPGRPGLIEPLGTHRDHRGHGHGTAITHACAAALADLGSSSMLVCTPTANVGGVATYVAAGMERLHERLDLTLER